MIFAEIKQRVCTATAGNDLTSKFLQGSGFAFTMLTQGFKAKGDRCTSPLPASTACSRQPCSLRVTPFCTGERDEALLGTAEKNRGSRRRSPTHQPFHPNRALQQLWEEAVSWGGGLP